MCLPTKIVLVSHNKKELKAVHKKLIMIDPLLKMIKLPLKTKRFTVLRSPHVNKTAREQFELLTYKWVLFTKLPNKILEHYLNKQKILRRNPGVFIKFK